jgi:hypothetical protein
LSAPRLGEALGSNFMPSIDMLNFNLENLSRTETAVDTLYIEASCSRSAAADFLKSKKYVSSKIVKKRVRTL